MNEFSNLGWRPDFPDSRDYTDENEKITPLLNKIISKKTIPRKVDLTKWCSPVKNQGSLGSCSAHAGVALIEFFENKKFGKFTEASRLFLYKNTRKLLHLKGDSGAYLRGTMGAMALFGVCPEEYFKYNIEKFDEDPDSFCYSFAKEYQAIKYYRLDNRGYGKYDLLNKIKNSLTSEIPFMFGFSVFNSLKYCNNGKISMPRKGEQIQGGHAVSCFGFDDDIIIINQDGTKSVGAIKIKNSWSTKWGENGFGWVSYDYILKGFTQDYWALIKNEWIDTDDFKS